MNIINELQTVFSSNGDIRISDKYTTFDIEYSLKVIPLRNLKLVDIQKLFELLKSKVLHDHWSLTVLVENYGSVSLDSTEERVNNFLVFFHDSIMYIDNEIMNLKFHVEKVILEFINIYNLESFDQFIGTLKTVSFLNIINNDLKKHGVLQFKLLELEKNSFCSRNIYFHSGNSELFKHQDTDYTALKSREVCYFGNQEKYPYSPNHFNLIEREYVPENIAEKLDRLTYVFSIVNIFDVTSITDNYLYYKLIGYKSVEGKICINEVELDKRSLRTYLKIFEWIYSEASNVTEKIGLARNILSIYLEQNSLQVSDDAYFSVQSGFKTYLQENLNRYLEVRSRISEQLAHINQKASATIEKYLNDYQKSSITFVSFFISILVVRVLSTGEFEDAFTKDATVLSFILLLISLLYLVFSFWNLNSEKNRLKVRYKNLKGRFQDLLIKEDIDKILRHDEEFNDEIDFINRRSIAYTILWCATVVIIFCAVLSLSSYFNWSTLAEKLKDILDWVNNLFTLP